MSELLTWDQMVEKYPNKWVVLLNPSIERATVKDGTVVAVLNDDEVDAYEEANYEKKYIYERTTEGTNVGVCHVENIKAFLRPE